MEFHAISGPTGTLGQQRTGCLVAGVYEGRELAPAAREIDAAARGVVRDVLARGDLEGRLGTVLLLHAPAEVAAERVLLVGLGPRRAFDESAYRTAIAAAAKTLCGTGATEAVFCTGELAVNGRDIAWKAEQAALAVMDSLYRFDTLKTQSPPEAKPALRKIMFRVADPQEAAAAGAALDFAAATAEGIAFARDLGNLPPNLCTPAHLAGEARAFGQRHGVAVNVLEREEMQQLGMGALLAVARGSVEPPKLIVMHYQGGPAAAAPIVLVGKGITFDAGGISIKPAPEMDEMKFDMCGAAAVFGAMRTTALMRWPINLVGIVPAAENMPSGSATRPGDVVTTMAGLTVEILDTDCEGRLALSDALTYARRFQPAALVDIATLTSEIVSALGDVASGLFANDDALAREIAQAGERAWDRVWRMPLWPDYQEALRSNFADLPNVGLQGDTAVTAACFLSRFAEGVPWAHLDIAGTAARGGADKGATGRPVALLAHFLAQRAQAHRTTP